MKRYVVEGLLVLVLEGSLRRRHVFLGHRIVTPRRVQRVLRRWWRLRRL
jgi:hypothetical protein